MWRCLNLLHTNTFPYFSHLPFFSQHSPCGQYNIIIFFGIFVLLLTVPMLIIVSRISPLLNPKEKTAFSHEHTTGYSFVFSASYIKWDYIHFFFSSDCHWLMSCRFTEFHDKTSVTSNKKLRQNKNYWGSDAHIFILRSLRNHLNQ